PHVVEYFHQLDDAYSYLASQMLTRIVERYDVQLRCHLVPGPSGKNVYDADLLLELACHDSALIAPQYGVTPPVSRQPPADENTAIALSILASLDERELGQHIADVSDALWTDDRARLDAMVATIGQTTESDIEARLSAGEDRRATLKHYSGAMFFYEGEWYWGVDRLHYLEARLAELGLDRFEGDEPLVPCPTVDPGACADSPELTLEFYPSLRSPYTAIVFDETVALAEATGITLDVRPVLPMVMRGVPATLEKGRYIFLDTAREARRRGVPYGRFFDPIGNPIRRCYSLFPWAVELGKGTALLSSFLRHAFVLGINTNTEKGLRRVVEFAGLDWTEAKSRIGTPGWESLLEGNRLALRERGLWGVPSYRLLDTSGDPLLEVWGQDRLWVVAQQIRRYADPGKAQEQP
ncbi:MAG: DsbA family protein, partial [Pseudomonadota bacterium]